MGSERRTTDIGLSNEFTLDGRAVTLIDTPGFDDTSKSDAEILNIIAAFLATMSVHITVHRFSIFQTELLSRYEKGSRLSGVICVHRISVKEFTRSEGRNFVMVPEFCGGAALKNVVLASNMWSGVPPKVGQDRENELASGYFKPVLDLGAQMVRYHNTVQSAHDIIRRIVTNNPVVLQIQRELVDERKGIANTTAGGSISQKLNRRIVQHQTELKGVRQGMVQALKGNDGEMVRELEEEKRRLQERMKEIARDLEGMSSNYAVEKERMEVRLKYMGRGAGRERERPEAERKRQLDDRTRRPQDKANESVVDRARLNQGTETSHWVTIPIYR